MQTTNFFNRIIFFRVVLVVVIIFSWAVLFLCALELYERIHWKQIRIRNEFVIKEQSKSAKFTQAFNESLWDKPWYTYKKNREVTFDINGKHFQIKTNNVGLRDEFIVIPKPNRLFRILCVGGSTTVEGWTNDTTYPNLLEKKLKIAFPDIELEVINGGISGLNSFTELEKIDEYLALQPDLILEYNLVNDICWLYFPLIKNSVSLWKRVLRQSRFLNRKLNWQLLAGEKSIRTYFGNTTLGNLSAFHKAAAKKGIPVIFCSFSRPEFDLLKQDALEFLDSDLQLRWRGKYVTYKSYSRMVDIYNQSLKLFCESNGIPYIPVAEKHRGGMNYFIDICHGTEKGIAKKVDIIFDYLKIYLPTRFKIFSGENRSTQLTVDPTLNNPNT
jgi:lysophospholipase L1-like esterase